MLSRDQSAELFAEQLLKLGEGRVPTDGEQFLTVNAIYNSIDSVDNLMHETCPNLLHNYINTDYISDRAILVPENVPLHTINDMLLNKNPEIFTYNAVDSIVDDQDSVNYPIEFFNSLQPSDTAPHYLHMKKGTPIMLLHILSQPKLCNGTRLIVQELH
ncbi:uncharacterized protein LOC106875174 [Octopus bimaculoides]|uniref:DNA helicase Pif1-like 2B domain-containing protein n=1 Tax=Octopus bimaculoides TaxID=37653 RepID=A0A0L8IBX8_OCTBM|nr:uncharacterized protein LOC106875174 [Octopus bimaculoides]|eukprot:XP_014778696.1 PREDICTED: uncharacterized protein LOC106875174 [Octopus bimaculoides]